VEAEISLMQIPISCVSEIHILHQPDVEKNAFERLLASFHFSGRNAFCVTGMNSKLS
jgi:hypothetical protein